MEDKELQETKENLNNVQEAMKQERDQEWRDISEGFLREFEDHRKDANLDLMMPESVFVQKYLPLFARLAVNKDESVTATDAWKEWMSMTIGGTREVGIIADSDLHINEENKTVSRIEEFPHDYVSYNVDPRKAKVLYKVPPVVGGVNTNTANISEKMKQLGIANIADTATAVKTQMNYTPASGQALVNKTISIIGQNVIPEINDYKQRWKEIFYKYYKPEAAKKEYVDKEEEDKEYDELW